VKQAELCIVYDEKHAQSVAHGGRKIVNWVSRKLKLHYHVTTQLWTIYRSPLLIFMRI